jgi:hypothetical protein
MGNRFSGTPTSSGNPNRTIALDATLTDEAFRSATIAKDGEDAYGGDPIRGLRNGLIASIAFWVLLYFAIQWLSP